MSAILWLLRRSDSVTSSTKEFVSKLQAQGHQISFLNVSEEPPTFDWLNQQIGQEQKFLFFSEPDLKWISKLNEVMSLLPSSTHRVHVWVTESFQKDSISLLEGTGIDEVVSTQDPVDKIAARLEFRSEINYQRSELRRQVRELLMKEARAETMLLQREEFLSVCAHDLRSPLGLIHSSLSLLLSQNKSLNPQEIELAERSKRQAAHGIRLVNDLLDVMSYEQGLKPQYQLVDLDQFLSNFYKDYAFQAQQKNIRLRYDNSLTGWKILMDPDRIQQLFQNLLVNAIKFTDSGKNIFLNVISFKGRRKVDPPYPMTIVSVRDEGLGIPEHEIEKIFNRFSQIKDYSRMEGRGLGLSVAKQISHLHDGNLWVKSIEGEGSTFFVLFPHVLSQPMKPEKNLSASKAQKVLIVDSDKDRQQILSATLARWGFHPVYAKDGIEMVTMGFYYQPDLILTCGDLSKLSDEEAAKILKTQLRMNSTPIFACIPSGVITPRRPDDSQIDDVLALPLERTRFEKAQETFNRKNPQRKKRVA